MIRLNHVLAAALLLAGASTSFAANVTKAQRDVLVFSANLSPTQPGPAKAFYDFISFAGVGVAKTVLTPVYRQVHVIEKSAAKRAAFSDKLKSITANPSVTAVDVIFISHGLTGSVVFSDTTTSLTTIKNDICAKVPAAQRAKLRIMFDTSCYGQSHLSGWIGCGFKAASGSKKIYADSVVSYKPFVVAWAANNTFAQSVAAANNVDPLKATDNAAKGVLQLAGWSNWNDVDSTRVTSGSTSLRISTMP